VTGKCIGIINRDSNKKRGDIMARKEEDWLTPVRNAEVGQAVVYDLKGEPSIHDQAELSLAITNLGRVCKVEFFGSQQVENGPITYKMMITIVE
jgi:hypothetical protein